VGNVLKALLEERHLRAYSDFIVEYKHRANESDVPRPGAPPTKSQYYRWVGDQVQSLPRGHHCAVLERMFPGWTAEQLFSHGEHHNVPKSNANADDDVLGSIAAGLEPALLAGLWVTGYLIKGGHHHVDLSTVTATGSGIKSRNHPPAPRFEDHASGHETDVTARLYGRHLMGHFRNTNDRYFYGSVHLAVLPGEIILDGYYTGFLNDTEVVCYPWRWVRVDPRSAAGIDLTLVTLGEPGPVYEAIASRTQFDGPIPLAQVIENHCR